MRRFTDKGYHVKENAPVYFTKDMERTAKWFEEVLSIGVQREKRHDNTLKDAGIE